MVQLTGYNAATTQAAEGFKPLPAGNYTLVATDSEIKQTKSGTGTYVSFTFEVLEGDFKGRKIFNNYNLTNPNQDATRIGHEQIKALAEAIKKPNAQDSSEFHNVPFIASIVIKKDAQYGDKNEIKSVSEYNAGAQAVSNNGASAGVSWA